MLVGRRSTTVLTHVPVVPNNTFKLDAVSGIILPAILGSLRGGGGGVRSARHSPSIRKNFPSRNPHRYPSVLGYRQRCPTNHAAIRANWNFSIGSGTNSTPTFEYRNLCDSKDIYIYICMYIGVEHLRAV